MIGDNLINREDSCGGDRERGREIGSLPLKSGELKPFANL